MPLRGKHDEGGREDNADCCHHLRIRPRPGRSTPPLPSRTSRVLAPILGPDFICSIFPWACRIAHRNVRLGGSCADCPPAPIHPSALLSHPGNGPPAPGVALPNLRSKWCQCRRAHTVMRCTSPCFAVRAPTSARATFVLPPEYTPEESSAVGWAGASLIPPVSWPDAGDDQPSPMAHSGAPANVTSASSAGGASSSAGCTPSTSTLDGQHTPAAQTGLAVPAAPQDLPPAEAIRPPTHQPLPSPCSSSEGDPPAPAVMMSRSPSECSGEEGARAQCESAPQQAALVSASQGPSAARLPLASRRSRNSRCAAAGRRGQGAARKGGIFPGGLRFPRRLGVAARTTKVVPQAQKVFVG